MSSEEDIDEDNQGPAAKPKRKLGDKVPPKKRASHFDTKAETVVGKAHILAQEVDGCHLHFFAFEVPDKHGNMQKSCVQLETWWGL